MRLESSLYGRPADTGLDACCPAGLVDLEDLGEPTQIEAHSARIMVADKGLDATHDRGAASEGDDGDLRSAGPVEYGGHLRFVRGEGDEIRGIGEVAVRGANRLRIGLAVGVQKPFVGIALEEVNDRMGWRHPRCVETDF